MNSTMLIEREGSCALPHGMIARSGVPELPAVKPPAILVALPDGGQAELPGALWPEPEIWAACERRRERGLPPPVEVRQLTRAESNRLAERWHRLGSESRPFGYHAFALFVEREPLALATAGSTHSATVDRDLGLDRRNTIELTRLCRSEQPKASGILRAMLRLWRDFLAVPYWPYFPETEKVALVSYSLPGTLGHVYRFDGWRRARGCAGSGGGGNWSSPPRAGRRPEALWVYWLAGQTPQSAAKVIENREREQAELAERRLQRAERRTDRAA